MIISFGVPVPARLQKLPFYKGFPVPFFAAQVDGVPDFRVVDANRNHQCAIRKLCWICGQKIRYPDNFCFVGGDLCIRNRMFADGPMHLECAEFSVQVCPYIVHDDARPADKRDLDRKFDSGKTKLEHFEQGPRSDKFYLAQVREFSFKFVPEEGHQLYCVGAYISLDQWKNGQRVKSAINL